MDLDSIADLNQRHALEVQIMEFGQIPKQVFTVPHPKRKSKLLLLKEPFDFERKTCPIGLFNYIINFTSIGSMLY